LISQSRGLGDVYKRQTKHTSEIQVVEFTFLNTKKDSENNKTIPSEPQITNLPINDLPF
jgi:single-strand DNA-binding protein